MKVFFFANSREVSGVAEMELAVSGKLSEAEVWERLIAKYPKLETLKSSARLARNGTYANAHSEFTDADEVAVIPPVSGG